MCTRQELEEIIKDKEAYIEKLSNNGCSPLSKKFLRETNKLVEMKILLENYKEA